jgi:chromosomal replication initiator protein
MEIHMNAEQAWLATMGQLKMDMSKAAFDTWVKSCELAAYEDGKFTIAVSNPYARDWLESRLLSTVTRVLTGIMNRPQEVAFILNQQEDEIDVEKKAASQKSTETEPIITPVRKTSRLNPRYTFSTFVVGPCNRLAHAASMSVAENPAGSYNPLYLYGGVGLGKTHLLHAIGNLSQQNGFKVLYVSSEEFTNDLIQSIRNHSTQEFRERYRDVDVLLIDDIQFIAGKEATQEEFFHTFNALHEMNKQIVICSDRPPKGLITLEDRLRSRFEMGLTADIQSPDLETRIAIMRDKAERAGKKFSSEILEMIAKRFQSNIRELEGALNRVIAFSELSGLPVNAQLVQTSLADLVQLSTSVEPHQVINSVANVFKVSRDRLLSKDRSKDIALPRQVAMYIMREDANFSLPQIGAELGGRDHTTVMYGCDKIAGLLKKDDRLRKQTHQVRENLFGPAFS